MNSQLKWTLELLLLTASVVLAVLAVFPVYQKMPEFPLLIQNFVYVFFFLNGLRYLFLLKYTPFSHSKWFKLILLFTALPLIIYLVDWLSIFQDLKDNGIILEMLDDHPFETQKRIRRYVENEYVFFGVGAILTGILLPFRMIISIWRVRNRGTV